MMKEENRGIPLFLRCTGCLSGSGSSSSEASCKSPEGDEAVGPRRPSSFGKSTVGGGGLPAFFFENRGLDRSALSMIMM